MTALDQTSPGARDVTLNAIDTWLIPADSSGPDGFDTLSAEERAQADRFVFPEHRRRFQASHVGLREILHVYTGVAPEALRFGAGAHGKPFLENMGATPPVFNLAHSGGLALVAVGSVAEIGADIECIRPLEDWGGVAAGTFHPDETEWVKAAGGNHMEAFFRVWTAEEACIKASGEGINDKMCSSSVIGPAAQRKYSVQWLELPCGYTGAVPYSPPERFVCQRWWRAKPAF